MLHVAAQTAARVPAPADPPTPTPSLLCSWLPQTSINPSGLELQQRHLKAAWASLASFAALDQHPAKTRRPLVFPGQMGHFQYAADRG